MEYKIEKKDIIEIGVAIELHETSYDMFNEQQLSLYKKNINIVDLLKTADALDRYRMPKLKWWIDDAHLKVIAPQWLKQTAFNLVLKTEREFLSHSVKALSVAAMLNI